jgi:pyrophosphate--fructose-6-phosphate 1-phosphotransferase
MELSALQKARYAYEPKLPPVLKEDLAKVAGVAGKPTQSVANQAEVKAMFAKTYGAPIITFEKGKPTLDVKRALRVGVILSGGQAPGGHNVITGLYDGLKKANKASVLVGFLGGPAGIMNNKFVEFDDKKIDAYRNTGGFDIIGSGRDKIEKPEQFAASLKNATDLKLDAVVVVGGDDSNTNAALLAEDFLAKGSKIQVIGCPKTIDGDLKNEYIETSFGFDTACKTYSELIGNIMRDCNSAKKYWHFIKLMGRSASHIGLECALQTQPNICLISEEVEAKAQSLASIVDYIAGIVAKRADKGMNYGVALIPEGLVEFIPEIKVLIKELNGLLAEGSANATAFAALKGADEKIAFVAGKLSKASAEAYKMLPKGIQSQLIADRDPHGNVQVSLIETEKLLAEMVKTKLDEMKAAGSYKGKFAALGHFFGYEGRCAFPSNFDSDYCYSLGFNASLLIAHGYTGLLSSIRGASKPAKDWVAGGIPLTMMMNMEERHGHMKPVIKKALVELDGAPFKEFAKHRDAWAVENAYVFPGAIQYWGPTEVCDQPTITLKLEQKGK